MRDYAKISCTLWGSQKFRSLPDDDCRMVYLYLHTNQHVNSVGCYVLRAEYALSDLGWDEQDDGLIRYRYCIDTLSKANLIGFDRVESVVRIVGYLRHDPFVNAKHAAGAMKIAAKLPACPEREKLFDDIRKEKHAQGILGQYGIDTVSIPNRFPLPEPLPLPLPEPEPSSAPARDAPPAEVREAGIGMKDRILAVLGLKGREFNTSGTLVVGGLGQHDLPLRLEVWRSTGLTDDQIISAIVAAAGRERQKDPTWLPSSVKYFDGRIRDFARDLEGGAPAASAEAPPVYDDPEMAAEDARIRAEWADLEGRSDGEAEELRRELAARLVAIKRQAKPPAKPTGASAQTETPDQRQKRRRKMIAG
jgi:hypothetical protein